SFPYGAGGAGRKTAGKQARSGDGSGCATCAISRSGHGSGCAISRSGATSGCDTEGGESTQDQTFRQRSIDGKARPHGKHSEIDTFHVDLGQNIRQPTGLNTIELNTSACVSEFNTVTCAREFNAVACARELITRSAGDSSESVSF